MIDILLIFKIIVKLYYKNFYLELFYLERNKMK